MNTNYNLTSNAAFSTPSTSWNDLPDDALHLIYQFVGLQPGIKKEFGEVNKVIREIGLSIVKSIRISAPYRDYLDSAPLTMPEDTMPEDIVMRLVKRYPNAEEIYFRFEPDEEKYLRTFITYLTANHQQHPLSHIKKMRVGEVRQYSYSIGKEFNRLFLQALSHSDLESITINASTFGSTMTGEDVKPILENSPHLKEFTLKCLTTGVDTLIDISFVKQSHLISAIFRAFRWPTKTIESLKACPALQTLVLETPHINENEVKQILINEHPWNLKRLGIGTITINSDNELDAITKKLPGLERLHITLGDITEDGFENLGVNCPHLRTLKIIHKNITDNGIDRLTTRLPHLEMVDIYQGVDMVFDEAFNFTEASIISIARNCPRLRILRLVHVEGIQRPAIEALVQYCKELQALEISHEGPVDFEDLCYLATNMTTLVYFDITYIPNITEEQRQLFKTRFPHLRPVPTPLQIELMTENTVWKG